MALTPPLQPPNAAYGAWLTPSMAFGQVALVQASSLPVPQFSTCLAPGVIAAPVLSITFEVLGSIASTPTSPQSRFRAHRPDTNSGRVSLTSMLVSSGGPYLPDSLRNSSALRNASLSTSGFMSFGSKKVPWPVPWDWVIEPTTSVTNQ